MKFSKQAKTTPKSETVKTGQKRLTWSKSDNGTNLNTMYRYKIYKVVTILSSVEVKLDSLLHLKSDALKALGSGSDGTKVLYLAPLHLN